MRSTPGDMKEGTLFKTNNSGDLKIIKYNNCKSVESLFVNTGNKGVFASDHIRKGSVADLFAPSIYGVGFIGKGKYQSRVNGKLTKSYICWKGVMSRCYCKTTKEKQPTYKDCSVASEWLNFQNFAEWHEKWFKKGFQIDKDILIKGNKTYSPEFCRMIPSSLNKLLTDRRASRGELAQGVCMDGNSFCAQISINGKQSKIGFFKSEKEAFEAYKVAKEGHIKKEAEKYLSNGDIEMDVYNALIKYRVIL